MNLTSGNIMAVNEVYALAEHYRLTRATMMDCPLHLEQNAIIYTRGGDRKRGNEWILIE